MKKKYTEQDKNCPHCGGKLSPHGEELKKIVKEISYCHSHSEKWHKAGYEDGWIDAVESCIATAESSIEALRRLKK